jgi:hypothetical protein
MRDSDNGISRRVSKRMTYSHGQWVFLILFVKWYLSLFYMETICSLFSLTRPWNSAQWLRLFDVHDHEVETHLPISSGISGF